MREPPRVTITDPSRPEPGPVDELDAEGPRSRRGLSLVLGAVVLLAGWRGADTVLDRRAAAAEERRLAGVVELEVQPVSGGRDSRDLSDVATVERQVGLRNTGPRPVELLSASFGPLSFEGTLVVRADSSARLLLARSLSCAERPQPALDDGVLRVSVRTADGDVVERRIPVPQDVFLSDPEALRRACGYFEPFEAGSAFPTGTVRLEDRALVTPFSLSNSGRDPVLLARLDGGSGMRAELVTVEGEPVAVPLEVAAGTGAGLLPPLALELRLTVQDCAAVVLPEAVSDVVAEGAATVLATAFARVGEPVDQAAVGITVLDAEQAVLDLVAESCG